MARTKVKVNFNTPVVAAGVSRRIKKQCQAALDNQVMKDSNFYAPKREGYLQIAAIRGTRLGSGQVIWDIIYAAKQYYTKNNKSKDQNPNARWKWFEYAKSKKKNMWIKLANKEYRKT